MAAWRRGGVECFVREACAAWGRYGARAAAGLAALAPQLPPGDLHPALDFLLGAGLADGAQSVRDGMVAAGEFRFFRLAVPRFLSRPLCGMVKRAPRHGVGPLPPPPHTHTAGVALVDAHGAAASASMLPLLEGYLESGAAAQSGRSELQYDAVRQGVVVLLGTLARHLDPASPKVRQTGVSGA